VWQLALHPIDTKRTQHVTRSRVHTRSAWAWLATYLIEPAGLLMTRRMLLGLKQRAEALRAASTAESSSTQRPAA
jgi:hypothetical protein